MPVGGSLLLPFQIFVPDALGDLGPISVDERFSTLLSTLAPEYVQSDHQKFIAFVQAYFEYLEIHGNPRAEAVRLGSYPDIDQTLDDFVQYFQSSYLNEFPENIESGADTKLAVKNSNAYYSEKGNARSIDYLFRLLFNTPADIDTPKDKLFKISDADYNPSDVLFTSHYNGIERVSLYKGSQVRQRLLDDFTSEVVATALIDDITFHLDDGVEHAKIFLKEVRGNFKPNHYVEFVRANESRQIIERTFPVISNLKVTNSGRSYARGDDIQAFNSAGKLVLNAEVETVNSLGEIQTISSTPTQQKIYFPGEAYNITVTTGGGFGAGFTFDGGKSTVSNRRNFSSQRSLLSSDSFVQDNFRFQNFSYIVKAEKQIKDYAALLRKIFHPAGSVMLSEFQNKNSFQGVKFTNQTYDDVSYIDAVIGNYMPYTFGTTKDFRGDTYALGAQGYRDYYPGGFNGLTGATLGLVNGDGDAITHDPFNNNTWLLGPLGGFTLGIINPEFFIDGEIRDGYEQAISPQLIYRSDDDPDSLFYIVARHPKTLLTNDLPPASSTQTIRQNATYFNSKLVKNHRGQPAIYRDIVVLTFDTNEGVSGNFQVGDIVRQTIPFRPQAIGEVTEVVTTRTSSTSFYTNRPLNQIIKEFNQKRSALDVGADVEVDEVVSSEVVSESGDSGLTLISAEDISGVSVTSYSDSKEATYASETRTVEVVEQTLKSGKKQLVAKTTLKTPEDIIKNDPRGSYQTSIKASDSIDAGTLLPIAIKVKVLAGEFSNQSNRNGVRYPVISDTQSSGLLATGLINSDKTVKGTVAEKTEVFDEALEFNDIVIGEFLEFLEMNQTVQGNKQSGDVI